MLAVSLALVSSALWGTADFLGGVSARKLAVIVVTFLSQLAGLISVGIVLVLTGSELSAAGAMWGAAAGIIGAATLTVFYAALAAGAMSLVAPLSACGAVVPVVVAIARGAEPGPWALAGMVLALGGIVLIAHRQEEGLSLTPRVIGLAAAAALGIGTTLTLLQQGTDASGTSAIGVVFAARVAAVVVVAAALAVARTVPRAGRDALPSVLAVGLADTGANTLFAVASEQGSDALAAVLGSLYPVMTVLLARGLLAERLSRRQAAGVVLALGGAALVSTG